MTHTTRYPRAGRAGVTLIEIMVAMTLVTIVVGMGVSMIYQSNRFVQQQDEQYNAIFDGEEIMNVIASNLSSCKIPVDEVTYSYDAFVQPHYITFRIPIDDDEDGDFFAPDGYYIYWGRPKDTGMYNGVGGAPGYVRITFVPSGEIVDESLPFGKTTVASINGISNAAPFTVIGAGKKNINAFYESENSYSTSDKYILGCFLIELFNNDGTFAGKRTVGGMIFDSDYNTYKDDMKNLRAVPEMCTIAVPPKVLYYTYGVGDSAAANAASDSIDGLPDPDPVFEVTSVHQISKLPLQIRIKFAILKFNPYSNTWAFRPVQKTVELRNPQEPWNK